MPNTLGRENTQKPMSHFGGDRAIRNLNPEGVRKVAALLASLPSESLAQILSEFDPEMAIYLRKQLGQLGAVPLGVTHAVGGAFLAEWKTESRRTSTESVSPDDVLRSPFAQKTETSLVRDRENPLSVFDTEDAQKTDSRGAESPDDEAGLLFRLFDEKIDEVVEHRLDRTPHATPGSHFMRPSSHTVRKEYPQNSDAKPSEPIRFAALVHYSPEDIHGVLARHRRQTIAAALIHLPESVRHPVLALFEPDARNDLLARMKQIGPVGSDVLAVLEETVLF